jgi:hypothetical protein
MLRDYLRITSTWKLALIRPGFALGAARRAHDRHSRRLATAAPAASVFSFA